VPNDALRRAIDDAGETVETLARAVGVDPKTAQRWISEERVPYSRHRARVAEVLGVESRAIWPRDAIPRPDVIDEVTGAWAHRLDAPTDTWASLFQGAKHRIEVLGVAALFLPEMHLGFCELLSEKAARGCAVRIALADPLSACVSRRDREEGLGGTLSARIRVALGHFSRVIQTPGVELRLFDAPMYNSVFRVDDDMFVTPHLYALHDQRAPMFRLTRAIEGGIFDEYAAHFERIWASTRTNALVGTRRRHARHGADVCGRLDDAVETSSSLSYFLECRQIDDGTKGGTDMKLPIDTSGMTFLAAGPPEPVLDFDSKSAKVDENGETLFAAQLVALVNGGAEVISVKVAGEPKGIAQGSAVRVTGLVASPWQMGERSGVSFRATRIEPVTSTRNAS
jgi:lambda repressor-like predicted transcriptional regulator